MELPAIAGLSTQLRLAHAYRPEGMRVFFGQRLSLHHHFREEVIDCNSVDLGNETLMVALPFIPFPFAVVVHLRHQEALKAEEPVQVFDRPHNGIVLIGFEN